jgi:CheY-like chemotaxis protein
MPLAPDKTILLVEDSPEDREATLRAIKKAGLPNPVHWCDNGDKALDYLHRRGEYADPTKTGRVGVILLDLNMPGTDGREVLSEVTQDPLLKSIPIVVLTTSSDARDIDAFVASGAKSYIVKPVTQDGIIKAVQKLEQFWSFSF